MKTSKLAIALAAVAACAAGIADIAAKGPAYTNPCGDKFPIVAYYDIFNRDCITESRFDKLEEGGFTLCFSNFDGKDNIKKADLVLRDTGIKSIFVTGEIFDLQKGHPYDFVSNNNNYQSIALWHVHDEPILDEFPACANVIDEIASVDPDRMPYVNLLPSYAQVSSIGNDYQEYVRKAATRMGVSFLSYDHYPFYEIRSSKDSNDWTLKEQPNFYKDLRDVSKVARDNGMPFWAFCMSSAHKSTDTEATRRYPVPTEGQLNLEANAALAYGAQGLSYFRISARNTDSNIYTSVPVDSAGNTNRTWEYIRKINLRIQNLAQIFLGNHVQNVWHTGFSLPAGTDPISTLPAPFTSIATQGVGMVVSHFTNAGRHFLMLVNRDWRNSQAVSVRRGSNVRVVNANGVFVRDNRVSFTLEPGGFLLFTWS